MARKPWHTHFRRSTRQRRTASDSEKVFDSLQEKKRYEDLRFLERQGVIRNLQTQVPFLLERPDLGITVRTPQGKPARYTADFVYEERITGSPGADYQSETWVRVIEDVKGYTDRESQFRIAVAEALLGIKVTIIKKSRW